MRISVVLLASLAASASTVGAQALERVAPFGASTTLLSSTPDRTFSALIAREKQSFFRFDVLSSTLEHTPGATGKTFEVELSSPPPAVPEVPAVISFGGARGNEPAPITTSPAGGGAAAPVEQAQEPKREPKSEAKPELPPKEVEKPGDWVPTPPELDHQEPDASPPVTSTPEPATIALTASGLAALAGYAKRRRKSNRDN